MYFEEIKKLKNDLKTNKEAIGLLVQKIKEQKRTSKSLSPIIEPAKVPQFLRTSDGFFSDEEHPMYGGTTKKSYSRKSKSVPKGYGSRGSTIASGHSLSASPMKSPVLAKKKMKG